MHIATRIVGGLMHTAAWAVILGTGIAFWM